MYRQEEEEQEEAAEEAAGEDLCHLSAYNRRLKPKWCFNLILWILLVDITHHKLLP